MASQAEFQAYTPNTPAATVTAIMQYMPRALRWTARNLTNTAAPIAADVADAECAYVLHLAAVSVAASQAENIGSIKLDDRGTVTIDAASVDALTGSGEAWLNTAWAHLYDAGLERGYAVGAAR